ncbi:hypothetical protein NE236_16340 [Actinoallomurus purpureus]|uniref:hypothetical protein n=1 Tax=Actinoallomurus purpureus TaxID=478114 RepID=UPI002093537F|nr:hypothetical protein [Actinoallomurus purpureus]MCO6006555.1 hypothetical protein [Actinoallomurus purpureus]
MLVTLTVALAALAVLAGIVVVAIGGGGELSAEHPDHPPLALPGRRSAGGTDAALLRLPMGLWGYHKQITDEALERFAHELTERDTRIAVLEQELAEARHRMYGPPDGTSWQPSVPSASPAPDALDIFDPPDSAPSHAGDLPPLPHRVDEPPRERAIEPPQTIVDKVVFDPRTVAERDAEDEPAPGHEDVGEPHGPDEPAPRRERDER